MANETIGTVSCAWCDEQADVRKSAKGRRKLYVMCPHCGQQWLNLAGGQDVILSRASMYGPDGPPENPVNDSPPPSPPSEPPAVNDRVAVQTDPPPPQRRGFFDIDF